MPAKTHTMHGRDHLPAGADPIPWFPAAARSFPDAIFALAETSELRGYWRLGEGAEPYLDTAEYNLGTSDPADLTIDTATAAMNQDFTPGALAAAVDDGAVAFTAQGTNADKLVTGTPNPDIDRFNLVTEQTICAFVRPLTSASTFDGGIAVNWLNGGGIDNGWGLFCNWPARTLEYRRRHSSGGAYTNLVGPVLPASDWSFVAATYNATDGHKLYIDATLVATDAATRTTVASNTGVYIGGIGGQDNWGFYGAVDEVSIWNATLTAAELDELMAASAGTAGTTGQVLTADENGNPVWAKPTIEVEF